MSRRDYTVETGDGSLSDQVRQTPVDEVQQRGRRRLLLVVLAIAAVVVGWAIWRVMADRPLDYADDLAHFKYGSIGSEPGGSIFEPVGGALPPYWIFVTLPRICPDKLPGGYASLGLIFEEGEGAEANDLPIGVSRRRRLGFDQVGFNCAVCHTGTVRDSSGGERRIVPGAPSHQVDLQELVRFVTDCTLDERLTAANVVGKAEELGGEIGFIDRLLLPLVIDRVKLTTLELQRRIAAVIGDDVPEWGPGRVDTFNPYKSVQFNWKLEELPASELIGAADLPSIWNQRPREGMQLHWDGNNDSVDERNLSAALGAGVTPVTVDHERVMRVRNWIWTLPPPEYPYPIDPELAARGETLYRQHCYRCHADHRFREGELEPGTDVGTVVPLADIDTDPHRFASYTYLFAVNQNTLFPGSEYRFKRFRKTRGYANHPLDGIWARAPYLHNGSVPTLRDLLEAPADRPATFYRGYDVYDPAKVGFVSDVAEQRGRAFFLYDTSIPGNGNGGHVYGVGLTPEEKDAIVEYLKRF